MIFNFQMFLFAMCLTHSIIRFVLNWITSRYDDDDDDGDDADDVERTLELRVRTDDQGSNGRYKYVS